MAISSTEEKVALLAIRPDFADSIIRGEKKVEFRKVRFRSDVSHIAIYASRPIQRIVGYFEVSQIEEDSPDKLWSRYSVVGGIPKQEFREYYSSCDRGIAIGIGKVRELKNSLPLSALDESMRAPQSFTYLSPEEFNLIRESALSNT